MDVRRTPGVLVIPPWIRTRLDRDEAVAAVAVRETPAGAGEVRVERGGMLVDLVLVPPGRVRLPDLDERAGNGPAGLVEHAPVDDDALAERLAVVLSGQVAVGRRDSLVAEDRALECVERFRQRHERPLRRAPARRAVAGIVDLHLGAEARVVRKDNGAV